ncbi:MarR family winged helix-turn-helix transcriptional regulator [Reyranella sp.]|uniref:MarR family winged helix-turn-helix transcriptional regulator n=1 Tax=Reyranella sp. TaxID=1929291 RepID=UPI003D0EF753
MELPERNLGFLLHDVARLMRKRFEQNARGLGLTRSQCQVLAHLARNEGIQQSGLADILEVEPITLTRLLDRLEEAELVERRAHPTDRRIRQLYLTEKVHPLLADIFTIGAATRSEALEGVAEAEREQLFALLSRMKSNLLAKASAPAGERSTGNG